MALEIDVPTTTPNTFIRVSVEHYKNRGEAVISVTPVETEKTSGGFVMLKVRLLSGTRLVWEKMGRYNARALNRILGEATREVADRSGRVWDAVEKVCAEEKLAVAEKAAA